MQEIVIIEDDADIAELLRLHLEDEGSQCVVFGNGAEGLAYVLAHPVSAIVLDINLPEISGIDVCRRIRRHGLNTPILMLTARSSEDDTIAGLETGADDYMTKPFSVRELNARIKALIRRSGAEAVESTEPQVVRCKDLVVIPVMRKVTLDGERLELTPKEFDLLYLLASNPGVTFDRGQLLNRVWGYNFDGYEHTVNSHINRLRTKVEPDPAHPVYILTTWGVGYRFADA